MWMFQLEMGLASMDLWGIMDKPKGVSSSNDDPK